MSNEIEEELPHSSPFRFRGGAARAVLPFCSWALRLECQGILARELAAAARRGLPLDSALEALATPKRRIPAWFLNSAIGLIFVMFALGFALGGPAIGFSVVLLLVVFPILLLGFSFTSEDYLYKLCRTLSDDLRRGFSLSASMRRHPEMFDPFEAALIQSGESSGRLADSFDSLAAHSQGMEQLRHTIAMAIYPLVLAACACLIVFFIVVKIVPKFQDICSQLGIETIPGFNILIFFVHNITTGLLPVLLAIAVVLVLMWILPRVFFNGSAAASLLYHSAAALVLSVALSAFWFNWCEDEFRGVAANESWEMAIGWTGIALSLPISILLVFYGSRIGRRFSGMTSDKFSRLAALVPGLRDAFRRFSEAKFLLTLGGLLAAGRQWPEALEEAGAAAGTPAWRGQALLAAGRARRGEQAEETLNSIPLLIPSTRASLRLGLSQPASLNNLIRELAAEDGVIARRELTRFNSWFFPLVHLFEGVIVAAVVLLSYLPMFVIPLASIGRE